MITENFTDVLKRRSTLLHEQALWEEVKTHLDKFLDGDSTPTTIGIVSKGEGGVVPQDLIMEIQLQVDATIDEFRKEIEKIDQTKVAKDEPATEKAASEKPAEQPATKKSGKLSQPVPLQNLMERLLRLENSANSDLKELYRNQQQLKAGLDAAEVNQRAAIKVLTVLFRNPLDMRCTAQGELDWGAYYKEVEAEIKIEQAVAYKLMLTDLAAKANAVDAGMAVFEESLREDLISAGISNPQNARAQSVSRFLNDLKHQVAKIKSAAEVAETTKPEDLKIEEFRVKLLDDALFMIRRQEQKRAALIAAAASSPVQETVTEFGGNGG